MKRRLLTENIINKEPDYKIVKTALGEWRSFMYANGAAYHEFTSHSRLFNLPLIHYTSGICPETGRHKVAKGVIAVGKLAVGIIAIGQLAAGIIAIGQLAFAILLTIAQAGFAIISIAQLAVGIYLAIGQFAFGYACIGQFAFGYYVIAQFGIGKYVWSMKIKDPQAIEFFKALLEKITP